MPNANEPSRRSFVAGLAAATVVLSDMSLASFIRLTELTSSSLASDIWERPRPLWSVPCVQRPKAKGSTCASTIGLLDCIRNVVKRNVRTQAGLRNHRNAPDETAFREDTKAHRSVESCAPALKSIVVDEATGRWLATYGPHS
jgi:hypothetical protein